MNVQTTKSEVLLHFCISSSSDLPSEVKDFVVTCYEEVKLMDENQFKKFKLDFPDRAVKFTSLSDVEWVRLIGAKIDERIPMPKVEAMCTVMRKLALTFGYRFPFTFPWLMIWLLEDKTRTLPPKIKQYLGARCATLCPEAWEQVCQC